MKFAYGMLVISVGLFSSCSGTSDLESQSDSIEISGQIGSGEGGGSKVMSKLAAASVTDYSINCVTLTSPAQAFSSALNSEGKFSLKVPANVSVGCFVVDTASQSPVASIYVEAEQKIMGSNLSSSMNLAKSADLGILDLDLEKREVRVPKARIAESENKNSKKSFELEEMNDKTYVLKCVPTGNQAIDANCQKQLEEDNANNTVYFRVLKAMQNGADIRGLGVWESSKAYQDCGSIDLSAADVAGAAQNDGITFPYADKVNLGGSFTIDNVLCPLRNPQGSQDSWQNIRKYYALGGIEAEADGYTLHTENESYWGNGCTIKHKTIVHFTGKTADKLNGQFYTSETKQESAPGACGQFENTDDNFIIELTLQ